MMACSATQVSFSTVGKASIVEVGRAKTSLSSNSSATYGSTDEEEMNEVTQTSRTSFNRKFAGALPPRHSSIRRHDIRRGSSIPVRSPIILRSDCSRDVSSPHPATCSFTCNRNDQRETSQHPSKPAQARSLTIFNAAAPPQDPTHRLSIVGSTNSRGRSTLAKTSRSVSDNHQRRPSDRHSPAARPTSSSFIPSRPVPIVSPIPVVARAQSSPNKITRPKAAGTPPAAAISKRHGISSPLTALPSIKPATIDKSSEPQLSRSTSNGKAISRATNAFKDFARRIDKSIRLRPEPAIGNFEIVSATRGGGSSSSTGAYDETSIKETTSKQARMHTTLFSRAKQVFNITALDNLRETMVAMVGAEKDVPLKHCYLSMAGTLSDVAIMMRELQRARLAADTAALEATTQAEIARVTAKALEHLFQGVLEKKE